MPKLKVISEIANVSISTVSRVLANKDNVSQETRERVLNALAEITGSDTPHRGSGRSLTVGVLVPEKGEFINDDPMTSIDMTSLREEIESGGNRALMIRYGGGEGLGTAPSDLGKLDAAVVNDPGVDDPIVRLLEQKGIPFVVTNGRFGEPARNYVDYNNQDGALQAVRHLVELGHERIGALTGPIMRMVSVNRLAGYRQALEEAGIPAVEPRIIPGSFSLNGGYDACKALLAADPRVTAIFAFSDLSAIGAIRALKEAGRSVPGDVSVVGFDDMELARYSDPQLTTVSRFKFDISALLARAADDIGRNRDIEHVGISLKTRLIVRSSTGLPQAT